MDLCGRLELVVEGVSALSVVAWWPSEGSAFWRPPVLSPKPQICSKCLQAFQQACKGSVRHSQIVTIETSLEALCTPFTCQVKAYFAFCNLRLAFIDNGKG